MSFLVEIVGYGLLVPALLSVFVVWLWQKLVPDKAESSRWPCVVGLAVGLFTSLALISWFPWWPESTWHWLPYVSLPAIVMAAGGSHPAACMTRWERMLLLVASAGVVAFPQIPTFAEPHALWILAAILLASLGAVNAELVLQRWPDRLSVVIFLATGLTAAGLLGLSGSAKFGQVAGTIAAASVGGLLTAPAPARQALCAVAIQLWAVFVLVGYLYSYSEIPWWCYILVVSAPLGCWVAALPFCCERKIWETVARFAGAAVLALAGLICAAVQTL